GAWGRDHPVATANTSLWPANCSSDLSRASAAHANGHIVGQAAAAAPIRHSLLRDARRLRSRDFPNNAPHPFGVGTLNGQGHVPDTARSVRGCYWFLLNTGGTAA